MQDAWINATGVVLAAVLGAVIKGIFDCFGRSRINEAVHIDEALKKIDADEDAMPDVKNYDRYSINGAGNYKKNRLVLEVIRRYVEQNKSVDYSELQQIFPKELRGVKCESSFWGCFNLSSDAEKLYRETGRRRHFLDEKELILLSDGCVIAVSTQWGRGNIECFIDHARELGFHIAVTTQKD